MAKKNIIAAAEKLKFPGVTFGCGDDIIYAYCENRAASLKIPAEVDGYKIVIRITGKIRPA